MDSSLHEGLTRSVRVERRAGAEPVVVKRFAPRGAFGGWKSGQRARREYEILAALASAGRPVPRPVALRAADAGQGFEVVMEWIDGARTLAALLAERPELGRDGALARELGRLVAELHAAGLDHPDLHAENVLVDAAGKLYAIDFHAARLRASLGRGELERALATFAAGLRETTSARFRARALRAWWRHVGAERSAPLGERWRLAVALESEARALRRSVVLERGERWLRESRSCRVRADVAGDARRRAFARAELGDVEVARALAAARAAEASDPPLAKAAGPEGRALETGRAQAGGRELIFARGPEGLVRSIWLGAARLEEHAVPAARPLAAVLGRPALAVLELPRGAAPVADAWSEPALATALGRLWGRLFDRGLAPPGLSSAVLWRAQGAAGLALGLAPALVDVDESPAAGAQLARELGGTLPENGEAFLAAWLGEQGAGRSDTPFAPRGGATEASAESGRA